MQTDHNSSVPIEQEKQLWSLCSISWLALQLLEAAGFCSSHGGCVKAGSSFPLSSPRQSGKCSAYLGLGREPSYWGQCCLRAGTRRGKQDSCFCFQFDPGVVGWAVRDSSLSLSLPEQWDWGFIALREYCPGYLWEFNACGVLQCLAAGKMPWICNSCLPGALPSL